MEDVRGFSCILCKLSDPVEIIENENSSEILEDENDTEKTEELSRLKKTEYTKWSIYIEQTEQTENI